MQIQFKVPAKTFLLGEYLALEGGPSLVLTHEPNFNVTLQETPTQYHPDSPAGRWLALAPKNQSMQRRLKFFPKVEDPFKKTGGFGSSTAEFIGAYLSTWASETETANLPKNFNLFDFDQNGQAGFDKEVLSRVSLKKLMGAYIDSVDRASGADLLAQLIGGVSYWVPFEQKLQRLSMVLPNLSVAVLQLGKVANTYSSLRDFKGLTKHDRKALETIVEEAVEALKHREENWLCACINRWADHTATLGLVTEKTIALRRELLSIPGVFAAKGCGAMGADTVVVFASQQAIALIEANFALKFQFKTHLVYSPQTKPPAVSGLRCEVKS